MKSMDEYLAGILITLGSNILFLDTCILLDVVRASVRVRLEIAETACRMDTEIRDGTLPFVIVLASLFDKEWAENLPTVREELSKFLVRHNEQSEVLSKLHQALFGKHLAFPDVTAHNFESTLEEICRRVIASAYTIKEEDAVTLRAMRRAREPRPPASKGKPEPKDCQIFEEFLELGRALRRHSFPHKIIFASSNTTDYGSRKLPKMEIQADLASVNAEFAESLNHAYHLASQAKSG